MGVKNFKKVFSPHGTLSFKDLKGLVLAIDASGEIYRGVLGTSKIDQLTDGKGNMTNYLSVILGVIKNLYTSGAKQIWVFDSPTPHPLKFALIDRAKTKSKAKEELSSINIVPDIKVSVDIDGNDKDNDNEDELFAIPEGYIDTSARRDQLNKQAFTINGEMINNVKRILDAFQIPYIVAPNHFEAEHIAADLTKRGLADAVLTNDPDALLFGATRVIMRNKGKDKKKSKSAEFVDYHLNILLENASISLTNLRRIGVILGCDFYVDKPNKDDEEDPRPYFKGVGPKTVLTRLSSLVGKKIFDDENIVRAMSVFESKIPPYNIVNEKYMSEKKGERPFRSSKSINKLVTWLVDDMNFNAKILVERFRTAYGLDKIRYKGNTNKHTAADDSHENKNKDEDETANVDVDIDADVDLDKAKGKRKSKNKHKGAAKITFEYENVTF
jgi:5'-3' exonuclease